MQSAIEHQRWRRPMLGWGFALAVPLLAWMVGKWIVAGDITTLIYLGLAVSVAAVSVAILNNWRSGVFLSIGWLLFEDLIRKYLGNNMIIYFAKDFLVGVTYVSFLFAIRRGKVAVLRPPFFVAAGFFFWLALLETFNANSPSVFYGFMGLKLYFYYVPLVFLGYALIRSEQDLNRLLVWNLGLAVVISLLGIIQAIVGPQFLNPSNLAPEIAALSHLYREAPISGAIMLRPNSVFVSDGRFASFLEVMWILGLGSAAYLFWKMQRRRIVLLGMALIAAAIVLSGSRSAFAYGIISVGVLLVAFLNGGTPVQRLAMRRITSSMGKMALPVTAGLLILVFLFPSAVASRWAFYSETMSPSSSGFEVGNRAWTYPIAEISKAFDEGNWLVGHGTGTASLGVNYVALLLHQPLPGIAVENGLGALILEMGILGPVLWIAAGIAILYCCRKVLLRLRGHPLYPLAFAIVWLAFFVLFPATYNSLNGYQNYVVNAYLWLLIGVLFRLPDLAASPAQVTPRLGA